MGYAMDNPEYQETSTEMRFAMAIGLTAFAVNVSGALYRLPSMAAFDAIIIWRGVAELLMWGGGAYALSLVILTIAPELPALLMREVEEATGKDLGTPKRDIPTGQPKRERPRPLDEEPAFEGGGQIVEAAPDWQQRVDAMDYGNGRMLINGHLIELPDGFRIDWLYTVARLRGEGELDKTLSLRNLDDAGVSRWGNGGSPANLTISVLENSGCLKSRGVNQPCDWTDEGKRVFPSPTDL